MILLQKKNRFIFVALYANPTQLKSVLGEYLANQPQGNSLFLNKTKTKEPLKNLKISYAPPLITVMIYFIFANLIL
jgi:hypothetical protein